VKPHTVQAADKGQGHQPTRARQQRSAPTLPAANEGKGKAQLFVESYWGDIRRFAGSYGSIDPKKKLVAAEDDACALPMFGFGLEPGFVFAEQKGEVFSRLRAASSGGRAARSRRQLLPGADRHAGGRPRPAPVHHPGLGGTPYGLRVTTT
jgi:hypothetical protein